MNKEYEIYYEAYDIKDAEERKKFILEKCGGDRNFFEKIMKLFPDEPLDEDFYGKYKIEKEIGRGGMGIVYLASYTENFESESFTRKVALKTISPEQKLDAKSIKKLLLEIKTLAELEHQNIARFLDIGTSEKGKPFLIMEFVDGLPLTEYCDKNKLSVRERLEFFRQILSAIEYSHRKGFIHCDIKPNNIIVDSRGTPKVIDFGIASKYGAFISDKNIHATSPQNSATSRHYYTTFFQNAFTINYAAPEQIKGERNLTEATDIYALGVVLYELLTGQLPIRFEKNASYQQLINTSESRQPPDLKKSVTAVYSDDEREKIAVERDCQTAEELKENLPNDLDEVVQKALAKRPSKRYKSVKDFDAGITDFLSEDSFSGQLKRAFSALYRKMSRRFKRIPMNRALAFGLALIILFGVLSRSATVRTIPYYLQLRFADNTQQINLSAKQKQLLDETIFALRKTMSGSIDEAVDKFNAGEIAKEYNAWTLSDLIISLSGADYPLDRNYLNSTIDKLAFSEECWKEEKTVCKMAVSGWVLWSKSRLNKPVSAKQLDFVLRNQSAEGWFPAHPYPAIADNASTYSTTIIILGLTEQLRLDLIAQNDKERVRNAVEKGVLWILKTRKKENKRYFWVDCPNATISIQTQSDGLDGITIFALHQIAKSKVVQVPDLASELKEIDSAWLERVSEIPQTLEDRIVCRCGTIIDNEVIFDRTNQITLPWSIAATVEAFPNGTLWQKAKTAKWLENLTFQQDEKAHFVQAEYLIALGFLRDQIS